MTDTSTGKATSKTPADFESQIARLKAIVDKLGSRDVPLAEAVQLYKEGNGLVNACRKQLDEAEFALKSIEERQDGAPEAKAGSGIADMPEQVDDSDQTGF